MTPSAPPEAGRLVIKKYPNRRYYDTTRSTHVTLEQIYHLICRGADVSVRDSKTDEDITTKVLAQIILEHDPPKLDIFPVELLHQLIRSNEKIIEDFVVDYLTRAFEFFCTSQQQFQEYLRSSLGLACPVPASKEPPTNPINPFLGQLAGMGLPWAMDFWAQRPDAAPGTTAPEKAEEEKSDDLQQKIDDLQKENRDLRERLRRAFAHKKDSA